MGLRMTRTVVFQITEDLAIWCGRMVARGEMWSDSPAHHSHHLEVTQLTNWGLQVSLELPDDIFYPKKITS